MEIKRLTKAIATVFTAIMKRSASPTYKFPKGGAVSRSVVNFINCIEKEFGAVTPERIVDACVTGAYIFRERDNWTVKQILGPTTIQRIKKQSRGQVFYQNQWLESLGLSRDKLIELIKDRSEHPQAQYIYIPAEELTKQRQLNTKTGFLICQVSTLGWSPYSQSCSQCTFANDCRKETERKYPEIYRLRVEQYGTSIK